MVMWKRKEERTDGTWSTEIMELGWWCTGYQVVKLMLLVKYLLGLKHINALIYCHHTWLIGPVRRICFWDNSDQLIKDAVV